jgi:hypothetical protein
MTKYKTPFYIPTEFSESMIPSSSAKICFSLKWLICAAPLGQNPAQLPHPLQRASFTMEIPVRTLYSMAEYGQRSMQVRHPAHRSGSIHDMIGAISTLPRVANAKALTAAPDAWQTESGISLGP